MNKDGKKEGSSSKGQKAGKSPKVNKTKWNENKTPAGEKAEKADDISNKFPNFTALNDEEKSAFFEALTAARKNVEKRGGPVRERFGTVHDEYLQYFNREEQKENDERPPASDPSLVLDAGDPPKNVEDKPRTSTTSSEALLKSRGKLSLLEHCESVIEEDMNKILGLYQKKKKNDKVSVKKTEVPKTERKKIEEKPKKKNETVMTARVSEVSVNMRNTPRFDALNVEEKEVFFKTLQEARNNIVKKNPKRKNEILPMESIMRRYGDDVGIKSVFTAKQEPQKTGQGKKNLKVKLTLTSGDNERLTKTTRETAHEKITKTEDVKKSKPKTTPDKGVDAEDSGVMDISQTEIQDPKREEPKLDIGKKASSKLSWTSMTKLVGEENPQTPDMQSREKFQEGKAKKPNKTPSIGEKVSKRSSEPGSEVNMSIRGNTSTSSQKPEKKKSRGAATREEKSSEEKKGEMDEKEKKQDSVEVNSVQINMSEEKGIGLEENEEEKRTQRSNIPTQDNFERKETREKQTDDKFPTSYHHLTPNRSKMESERKKCEETYPQEENKEPPHENKPEEKEECSPNSKTQENLKSGSFKSVKREEREVETPNKEVKREVETPNKEVKREVETPNKEVKREEKPSEECREEETGTSQPQKVCQESEKPSAKVMIVDDSVINKIRNLIHYLEAKATPGGSLEAEYIKLIVDYVDYLSKVLETLLLEKKTEQQSGNEFVDAHVHLKFDEAKNITPEVRKFVPRSVSEQDFAKNHYQHQEEKKKKDEKSKEKESTDDEDFMLTSDSDSPMESDTEIHYVPPAPANKHVVTTKIRLLQDLIKKRAEFVKSDEEFKIVYHPQEEFVPEPKSKIMKIIKEEEDSPIHSNGMKLLNALLKFCKCGKKTVEEDGVFENLKGEVIRVDVSEDKRDATNATINRSTLDVLKASGRKKIIEKYYSKEV